MSPQAIAGTNGDINAGNRAQNRNALRKPARGTAVFDPSGQRDMKITIPFHVNWQLIFKIGYFKS